ncbi:hypothetical protein [Floccifex sp.]|uniref:hypothetical protein n=1 Tax=Floccifex sp. TaxID=2815810 RepID=UPI003EFF7528
MNQDQLIYDKAKKRVNRKHWTVFSIILVYFITFYLIFQMNFISKTAFPVQNILLSNIISEICLYGLLFCLLSTGKKFFRFLFKIGILYSHLMLLVPIYYLINDFFHFIPYLIWLFVLEIKNIYLLHYNKELHTNRWAKIFYDLEIEIEDDQDIEDIYLKDKDYKKDEEPYTLPQLCLRLGICIYGSLFVIPICIHVLSPFFASNDLQTVFATKAMFIFCIYTAVVWTIPLFCFYYNHPASKKVVGLCFIFELLRVILYSKTLYSYYVQDIYPIRVFIFFILADFIRYALLLYSLKPLFQKNVSQ